MKFAFQIVFLFYVPAFQLWGWNIAFYMYVCLKIILVDWPELFHIFISFCLW